MADSTKTQIKSTKSQTEARLIRGIRSQTLTKFAEVAPKQAKRLTLA